MSAILHHITLRLWISAMAGGLICTLLLPPWQRIMGLEEVWIPVLAAMTGCFALCGFAMNRIGWFSIRRQIAEAAVWERAGMSAEAEAAFERAKAAYDGFWLSPLQRRRRADGIILRLARFCLAKANLGRTGRAIVLSYLHLHPEDETIALEWLERALQQETHSRDEHEAAARINEAMPEHEKIQRLLVQFYLTDGRSDFEAMQTYRRCWQLWGDWQAVTVRKMARLLLNENCLSDWALQVYLKGYALGDADCLEGLAASLRWLQPYAQNQDELAQAERIIAGLDEVQRRELDRRLEPPKSIATTEVKGKSLTFRSMRHRIFAAWAGMGRNMAATAQVLKDSARQLMTSSRSRQWWASGRLRRTSAWITLLGACCVLFILTWRSIGRQPEYTPTPEPQVQATQAPVDEPFTIQVAAYLKSEDAQAYVERLRSKKIDAFRTKVTSADRTWYQVKVSRFPTKEEARKFGEALKTQGVIDDFYVSNYTP